MTLKFETDDKGPKVRKIIIKALIWILEIGAVIGLSYVLCAYCVEKTSMIGDSMSGILEDGTKILINKLSYRIGDPERFDVIVFKQSGREHSYYNIKRIIGLPGETVVIKDGQVYINDEPLEEKITVEPIRNSGLAEDEIVLDENEYFVLGDNRNNSEDSRFANIGNVLRSEIVGKAWVTLSPFNFINEMTTKQQSDSSGEE